MTRSGGEDLLGASNPDYVGFCEECAAMEKDYSAISLCQRRRQRNMIVPHLPQPTSMLQQRLPPCSPGKLPKQQKANTSAASHGVAHLADPDPKHRYINQRGEQITCPWGQWHVRFTSLYSADALRNNNFFTLLAQDAAQGRLAAAQMLIGAASAIRIECLPDLRRSGESHFFL